MSQKEMQQLLMLFVFDQGEIIKPVDCVCDKGQNNWQKNVLFNDSMNNAMCMREAPPNNNQMGIGQIAVRPRPTPALKRALWGIILLFEGMVLNM